MNLDAAAAAIVDQLRAGGVRATVDERDLNPPCVWVKPPAVTFRFGKGYWDAAWTLQAVVPDSGRDIALGNLGSLLEQVQDALGNVAVTAVPISLLVPGGSAPYPGYELTYSQRIERG